MVKNPFIPLDFAPRAPHIFAMSLPPGFLDELRTRVPISQVVGRKVSWDMRKSNQGKGDYWAPCPFHQEKTASFHVQDTKGFYYCFGCQAKGDAIGFIKETENVGFMEAVEILASEAGMSVPKPDPKMAEKADRRKELADVMDEAVRWFQMVLKTGVAADARAYLSHRGLNGDALTQFEIGFAPNDRTGLKSALMGRGISEQQLVDTGLVIKPEDGGTSYDRFRGRIMYPIRDARGRCVAFGGRAMDPNARAKYLNSPETILFDKGRSLYNHGPARAAVGRGHPLIIAEGYMDVIALVRAGFEGAVAPLGTAITENQLAMMWQITPEPIVALDGDKAGLRAAYRLIDLAMPLLQTGRALRFALMPEGQDPDDLLSAKGAGAVQAILHNAMPLVELLWRRETESQTFDSPDRKAALDKRLRGSTSQIQDQNLRSHYDQAIKDLRWDFFRAARSFKFGSTRNVPQQAGSSTKGSVLAAGEGDVAQYLREAVILAILIRYPELVYEYMDELAMLDFEHSDHPSMLRILMRHSHDVEFDPTEVLSENLGADSLEKFMALGHLTVVPCLRRLGDIDMARLTMNEELGKLGAHRGLEAELQESSQIPEDGLDEWVFHRLGQAADAANRAQRADQDDQTQYDVADNGARISRDERNKLNDLIGAIRFQKTKK